MKKTYVTKKGYSRFKDSGKYVHRWVEEKKLGRKLKAEEVVHHKDGNTLNNSPGNLKVYKIKVNI
ncbi:HNH endonuclease [Treponema endosymbiont of Eucomonympha sp.]|uniref:HNH endonuclease n=1 Tax=Treponema endosymbiont of Eucomonympha sp. TaxID=1580831 RepID=UPI001396B040|nr:HNH endonuclease [Treponema endosymbiont of Eucomonympha sp.]